MRNVLFPLFSLFFAACEAKVTLPEIEREFKLCGELDYKVEQLKELAQNRDFKFAYGTNPVHFHGQLTVRLVSDEFELDLFNISSPTTFTARLYPSDEQSDVDAEFDEIMAEIASRLGQDC